MVINPRVTSSYTCFGEYMALESCLEGILSWSTDGSTCGNSITLDLSHAEPTWMPKTGTGSDM